ncbi:hypothetical protein CEXT_409381 [Caerostris extrusa]|uniref:Uncharacterized protein n=1 Tax=Caerostris extrusa TaxID=172846 RepID=A0AAV4RXR9_CAEEX|nr:hypothetical protein CEXT_409381 [Caerostris extrusa]
MRLLFTHFCLLAQDILFPSQNEGWWRKRLSVGDVMFGEPYLKNLTWGGSLGSMGSNRSMPKAKSQGVGLRATNPPRKPYLETVMVLFYFLSHRYPPCIGSLEWVG